MTPGKLFPIVLAVLAVIAGVAYYAGSSNAETPAGYVGYVTQGALLGSARFIGLQTGPTSTGIMWLAHVQNISVTPYNYDEPFTDQQVVLSKDNVAIGFSIHITFQIDADRVKEFVEHYSTLNDGDDPHKVVTDAYNNLVEQPLRSIGRDEISKFDAMEIQENIGKISDAILDRVLAITKSTPFHVMSVVVGTIQYPPALSAAVADKVAETQRMQQKEIAIKTAEAEARRKEADAVGIAKANEIINKTLTPEYIQYLAVEAQSQTISGPGHTVVYIPSGPMGVPLSQVQVIPTTQDNGK